VSKLVVVIDDERTFDTDDEIIYLRTVDGAISWLAQWWMTNKMRPRRAGERRIDELWFDHDLGESGEAIVVARFLWALESAAVEGLPIEAIYVHSQNPVGAENILSMVKGCAVVSMRSPLPELMPSDSTYGEGWS
jgi:hypothetical protein